MSTVAVEPEKILKELRELWSQLGKQQEGGVLRACSMTLIVAAENCMDGEMVRRATGVLMHSHPNRAIILCPSEGAALSGRVFAECWMPLGKNQQICSEGIEITADPVQYDEVSRILVPLIVSDLPVVLWCRGARAFLDRALDPLFSLASKVIFDTGQARHAPSAIGFLRRMHQDGHGVADLAWTRLTPWREVVSHIFDDRAPSWTSILSARVFHGGENPDSMSIYLCRWLEKAASGLTVSLVAQNDSPAGLIGVELSVEGFELSIRTAAGTCLEVRAGDRVTRSPLPPADLETIMGQELAILSRDPAFDRILE